MVPSESDKTCAVTSNERIRCDYVELLERTRIIVRVKILALILMCLCVEVGGVMFMEEVVKFNLLFLQCKE